MSEMSAPERFHLLFVCTANICRSPIAAELARVKIKAGTTEADARRLVVGSAGTHGHEGAPMDPGAAEVLRPYGSRTTHFSARGVTPPLVAAADLVLTAERRHRKEVVALWPRAHARVFTLTEFARLSGHVERLPREDVIARAAALVRAVARLRGRVPPQPGEEDIADPHLGPIEGYRACGETIERALERPLLLILRGSA